jgi:hypothetical protein
MKVKKWSKGLLISILVSAVLLGTSGYAATCELTSPGTVANQSFAPLTVTDPMFGSTPRFVQPIQAGAVIMEWNQEAARLTLLPASNLAPVQHARVMAIVQVAIHDAVNGITKDYETYLSPGPAPENASPEAAAIAAAHHALVNLFSGHAASLETFYANSLSVHGLLDSDPGIEYGRSAAAAILTLRASDNSAQAQFNYSAPGAGTAGIWVPLTSVPALLPGWGDVTPFVIRSASQFSPEPPPALDSERYARDYNEIKAIGKLNSPTRTSLQTQIATFWRASPTAIWNPVIQQVVAARNPDLSSTARTFALVYLAVADASIACWEAKYTYNFWRPQPAINNGDVDGNDLTAGDATWTPLFATPPHPEYTSGHSTNSSAMATILELLFEDNPGVPITVTISGITRQWDTFSAGVDEVIDARVYSGIHFRSADEVGAKTGRQIARFVSAHALRPCRGAASCS